MGCLFKTVQILVDFSYLRRMKGIMKTQRLMHVESVMNMPMKKDILNIKLMYREGFRES